MEENKRGNIGTLNFAIYILLISLCRMKSYFECDENQDYEFHCEVIYFQKKRMIGDSGVKFFIRSLLFVSYNF